MLHPTTKLQQLEEKVKKPKNCELQINSEISYKLLLGCFNDIWLLKSNIFHNNYLKFHRQMIDGEGKREGEEGTEAEISFFCPRSWNFIPKKLEAISKICKGLFPKSLPLKADVTSLYTSPGPTGSRIAVCKMWLEIIHGLECQLCVCQDT